MLASIRVDPRTGSGDLVEPLRILKVPVPPPVEQLAFGDVEIVGRGPEERPVLVGVEIKKLSDLLQCITDKRFSGHQLPGLMAAYEVAYLLVEGIIGPAANRELLEMRPLREDAPKYKWERASRGEHPWLYEGVQSYLRSVEQAGVRVAHTPNRRGTVCWVASLFSWWSKAWGDHKALLGIRMKEMSEMSVDPLTSFIDYQATRKMKVALNLSQGVGDEKARAAAAHFRSVKQMVNAPPDEWRKVPGIGVKLAQRIVASIEEES